MHALVYCPFILTCNSVLRSKKIKIPNCSKLFSRRIAIISSSLILSTNMKPASWSFLSKSSRCRLTFTCTYKHAFSNPSLPRNRWALAQGWGFPYARESSSSMAVLSLWRVNQGRALPSALNYPLRPSVRQRPSLQKGTRYVRYLTNPSWSSMTNPVLPAA